MKSKKYSIVVSIIIIAVSASIFTILNFHLYPDFIKQWLGAFLPTDDLRNYCMTISSGALTSALVTLLISCSEYGVEKRKALEDFCDANIRYISVLYHLQYFKIDIPVEMLKEYYSDISQLSLSENMRQEYESEKKIKEYIWEHESDAVKKSNATPSAKMVYLKTNFDKRIKAYDKQIDTIMKQYISLSENMDKHELTTTFSRIDFLFGNKKYRKDFLHEKMYMKQLELRRKIQSVVFCFKEYYEEENTDKPKMIDFIIGIQNYLFSIEQKNGAGIVYMQYLYDMNCNIYKLLKFIYKNKKYQEPEPKIEDFVKCRYCLGTQSTEKK